MIQRRSEQIISVTKKWIVRAGLGGVAYCHLAFVSGVLAQEVLAPRPIIPTTPPAVEDIQTNSAGFIDFGNAVPDTGIDAHPFQVGPLDIHPHLFYRFLYATGVESGPGLAQDTITQDVSPGVLVNIGKNWTLDYTPTWTTYSEIHSATNAPALHDTVDHAVILNGGAVYGDWVLGFGQTYSRSDTPLIETGGQTVQESFATTLTGSYRFNTVMSMDLSAEQDFMYTDKLTNTREWSSLDWFNYQFWPRLDGSLGIGGGYDSVSMGFDSTFEQYQARVNWRATDVTSFQVHGGVEDRQFLGSSAGNLINPIFGGEIKYKPFEVTAIVVDANRAVSMSAFEDQVLEDTGVTATLNQRLLKKLFFTLSGGYHWDAYVSTSSATGASRRDQYYSINAELTCVFLKRGTIAVTYLHGGDWSSLPGYGYSTNQYGFQLGYHF